MKNKILAAIAITLLFVCDTNFAWAQSRLTDVMPTDPAVKIGQLPNGLTYYIRRNTRPEKKVELRLVVNAGSILEDDDQQGLAHFVEHMAFNGSRNFKRNEVVSFLQSIGVEYGADLNAYTGFNETVYILPIPTEKKENILKGFQILQDWASTVAFETEAVDKERSIVLEESRMGKGADDRMLRVVYPKMFEGSKYAERLPIGKDEIIQHFKHDALKRFYQDWYRPDLMAVIVVGDIDLVEMEMLIKKYFEKLKVPAKPKTRELAEVPPRKKSEGLVVTDPEATNHILQIIYSYGKTKPEITLADFRTYLTRRLFQSMLSQRLQELTQKAEPPFIFGSSSIGGYARGFEGFSSFAYVSKAGVDAAVRALIHENERARKFGVSEPELERTKKMIMKHTERRFNERDKTESADHVEEYVLHFLDRETAIAGIENEFNYTRELLDGISLHEVNAYAAKNIPADTEHKLVVLTGPEKGDFPVPSNEELLAMADRAAREQINAYSEKVIATSLLEKIPAAGKITAEKNNAALNLTELTLSNGVNVILKATDFKNDQVVLTASRFGGQYLFDPKDRFNAEFSSAVITTMGVGQFSPIDLRKVLAGKNVSVQPRLSQLSESVSGQCSAADAEALLQLTHLYFTQPRQDEELFKSFVAKQESMYRNLLSDPEFVFQDSLLSILYKRHPWAPKLPKAEDFGKIDLRRTFEIYRERFANASGFTFVIVGTFDIAEMKKLVSTYLGSLPSTGKISAFKDVGLRPVRGPLQKEIRKGKEQKSFIRIFWNGEAPYSDTENLKLQALVEVLNIKLIETLREEIGGIYNGGVYGNLSKNPYNNYTVGLSLPCGPENVNKLIVAAMAEIEKIKTNGPSADDLNKVKETWKQQYDVNIKDNSYWARQLLQAVELNGNTANILSYPQRVSALTPKDVKEAANKYLGRDYVTFVLNPEK